MTLATLLDGQEAHLLQPMLESTREGLKAANIFPDVFERTKVIADAGYHSAASVSYTQQSGIDAYVADRSHRQRDPAFADYDRYKIRFRKEKRRYYGTDSQRFTAKDFIYDENDRSCRCPAGNRLYGNGTNIKIHGFLAMKFRGAKSVCGPCLLRERCLKTPERTETKQMTIFIGRTDQSKDSPIEKMKRKFDTLFGRFIYNKRIAIVEPVFANLKNKGLNRFTLRGKKKVNTQWQLFSLVHNTGEHVEHAQNAALLRLEQLIKYQRINTRDRDKGTDAVNYQRAEQEQQPTLEVAKFVQAGFGRSQGGILADLVGDGATRCFDRSARTLGHGNPAQFNRLADLARQINLCGPWPHH